MTSKKSKTSEKEEVNIMAATIKEGFCTYKYEIVAGKGIGDTVTRKGAGLVLDDMPEAFQRLAVHLAFFSDIFKHKGINVKDINKMHNNELTGLVSIDGFQIKGGEDDMQVILIGIINTAFGWNEIKTSPIPVENSPSYTFAKELKEEIENCREEVRLYKDEGKYEIPEPEVDKKQLTIDDQVEEE